MKRWIAAWSLVLVLAAAPAMAGEQEGPTVLEEMVVTSTRTEKKIDEAPSSVTVITREDLKLNNYKTIDEAVERETGVFVRRSRGIAETVPTMTMRGLTGGDRILVLKNGVPINSGYDGATPWNNFNMGNVERIEVSRGPGSSLYGGNAMGGVINIITSLPEDLEASLSGGAGSLDSYRSTMRAGDHVDDFRFGGGLEYETTGGYPVTLVARTPSAGAGTLEGGYGARDKYDAFKWIVGDKGDNWASRFGGDLTAAYDTSEKSRWRMDVTYGRHKYGYDEPNSYLSHDKMSGSVDIGAGRRVTVSPNNFVYYSGIGQEDVTTTALSLDDRTGDTAVKASMGYQYKEKWYTLAGSSGNYDTAPGTIAEYTVHSPSLDLQLDTPLSRDHLLTWGFSTRSDFYDSDTYNMTFYRDEHSKTNKIRLSEGNDLLMAGYAQDEWKATPILTLYGGLRLDGWYSFGGRSGSVGSVESFVKPVDWALSPRLAAVLNPLEDTYLKTSLSRGFRPPNIYELYSQWTSGTTTYLANPNLKPEISTTFEMGLDQYFLERELRTSITGYFTRLDDAISSTTVAAGGGTSNNIKYNLDQANIQGLELETDYKPWQWLRLWANYAYTWTEVMRNDADPSIEGNRLPFVPRDLLNVGTDLTWGMATLSLSGNYVGDMYTTDTNKDANFNGYDAYNPRWLFDTKLLLRPDEHWDVSLAVENLFDEEYAQSYQGRERTWFLEVAWKH
jgi:iron complex outermembrane receptor protein